MMTCDEAIEKLKKEVIPRPGRGRREEFMKAFNRREPVFRELYLNAEEQVHLLKSDPAGWNRWIEKLFAAKEDRASLLTNFSVEPLFSQLLGRIFIQLKGANFDRCDLSPVVLKNAEIKGCSFQNASLEGSFFEDCDFHDVSFKSANLRHVNFWINSFHNTDFDKADISYAQGDVYFHRDVHLGGARVEHNTLYVTNYDILPRRYSTDSDSERHRMSGRIIQQGARAKFFPFTHVLYDVEALT